MVEDHVCTQKRCAMINSRSNGVSLRTPEKDIEISHRVSGDQRGNSSGAHSLKPHGSSVVFLNDATGSLPNQGIAMRV
jgi:hypothetical protein